jgi:hypothetical protein
MSPPARTLVAFALYMTAVGAILVVSPNTLLALVRLPSTSEIWIRVLGMFMIIVSYYYYRTAVSEATAFFRATVYGRIAMALFLTGLAVAGMAGPVLVLFGLAELAGAAATALALRSSSGGAIAPSRAGARRVDR